MIIRKDISEAEFQKKVIAKLKGYGPRVWFTKISQRSKSGDPDLLICVCGLFFAWELKKEWGTPTALQEHTIKKMRDASARARFVRPSTFEEAFGEIESVLSKIIGF